VGFRDWLSHAWNVFRTLDRGDPFESVANYGTRPDRVRLRYSNEKSIISSIYTRMAIDVSDVVIKHVRLDDKGRYESDMDSGLNECLTVSPNIDQGPRAFRQDYATTLFGEGVAVIVPVDTTLDPNVSGSFEIQTLRIGEVVRWSPKRVRVSLYNEETGKREEVTVDKKFVSIVENPLYAVMNEPNSTLQRLIRKLNLLDVVDEQTSSGKLDMIIQLPYVAKSEVKRKAANDRRKDIELQLRGSQYGIAYIDGTEKITQLNRPSENNLLKQVEYLTELLYSQLGITKKVMDGTADEAEMLNYHQRTIKPIVTSLVEAMRRSFLTKTARSQRQSIMFFRDPFALVPVSQLAEFAETMTRNEIATANEIRAIIGLPPAKDAKADQLVNSNMPVNKRGDPNSKPQAPDLVESEPPS
jgi:hypothetical protein